MLVPVEMGTLFLYATWRNVCNIAGKSVYRHCLALTTAALPPLFIN